MHIYIKNTLNKMSLNCNIIINKINKINEKNFFFISSKKFKRVMIKTKLSK